MDDAERKALWLADRRTVITGTEVAAILGLSKWASPMTVWLSKKGMDDGFKDSQATEWGRRLERTILQAYAEKMETMLEFADPYELIKHRTAPLGATLDAVRIADGCPVDAKNIRRRGEEWGEDGTDQVPSYYAAQLMAQIVVTGSPCADLAVLFSGQEFASFRVWRDKEAEAMMLDIVTSWWEKHIIGDMPPPVDGSDATSNWVKKFRQITADLIEPTEDTMATADALRAQKEKVETAKEEQARLENILKHAIGDKAGIAGICTWKQAKPSLKRDYEGAWMELTGKVQPEIWSGILANHTTETPGSRRFLLTK